MTDDQKAIDVVAALQGQAEGAQQTAEELRALSVNVMNLVELARVQHSVLKSVQEFDERERQAKWYGRDLDGWLSDEVDEVIAKYNAMMGVRNE